MLLYFNYISPGILDKIRNVIIHSLEIRNIPTCIVNISLNVHGEAEYKYLINLALSKILIDFVWHVCTM
jgi:hypothetical protein